MRTQTKRQYIMEKKRVIEVIHAFTTDSLCAGCQKYGHIDISCTRCAIIAGRMAIDALKDKN